MAKLQGPLFSLKASKTLGKILTYQTNKDKNICRLRPVPKKGASVCQNNRQTVFLRGCTVWRLHPELVSPAEKACWTARAESLPKNSFNLFMSEYLENNLNGCNIISPEVIPMCGTVVLGYFLLTEFGGFLFLENSGNIEIE